MEWNALDCFLVILLDAFSWVLKPFSNLQKHVNSIEVNYSYYN